MSVDQLKNRVKREIHNLGISKLGLNKNSQKNFYSRVEEILIENVEEMEDQEDDYTIRWKEQVRLLRVRQKMKKYEPRSKSKTKLFRRSRIKRREVGKKVNF